MQHPSGLRSRVCVHGFRRGCRHSFSAGPLKRLKRPHDRYVIPRCSRPAVGRAEHDRRPIVIADSRDFHSRRGNEIVSLATARSITAFIQYSCIERFHASFRFRIGRNIIYILRTMRYALQFRFCAFDRTIIFIATTARIVFCTIPNSNNWKFRKIHFDKQLDRMSKWVSELNFHHL